MKEFGWPLEKAYNYVKQKRSITRPNAGFMRQLSEYEGILDARWVTVCRGLADPAGEATQPSRLGCHPSPSTALPLGFKEWFPRGICFDFAGTLEASLLLEGTVPNF